jgi:hypothetical protein
VTEKPGKKSKSAKKRGGPLRIDAPFEDAIKAALETKPPPDDPKSKTKKG